MILKIKSDEKCSQEDLHTGMVLMNTQHVPTHNSVIIYAYTVIYKKKGIVFNYGITVQKLSRYEFRV